MPAVRRTIHLAYTMGHTAGSGAALRDDDLAAHAVRLARAPARAAPRRQRGGRPAGAGAAHRGPRRGRASTADGAQVLLADADRTRGTAALIAEGLALVAVARAAPGRSACRRDRRRARPGAVVRRPPTGRGSSRCTTRCWRSSRARRSPSGAASRSPTCSVRRPGWPTSTRCSPSAGSTRYPYAHAARAQMLERLGRPAEAAESWAAAGRMRPHRRRAVVLRGPSGVARDQRRADLRQLGAHLVGLDDLAAVTPAGEVLGDHRPRSARRSPPRPGRRRSRRRSRTLVPNWPRSPYDATAATRTIARTLDARAPRSSPRRPATSRPGRSRRVARPARSVRSTDRTRLTRNVRIPASVSATRYQTEPFSTSPSGCTMRSVSLRVAVGVAEAHLDAVDDGPLQLVEVRGPRHGRAAPAGGVEHDGRRRRLGVGAERLGQRLDELAQRRLGLRRGRRRRAGDHEQRPRLGRREPAEVGAGTADQRPAAAPARPASTPGCRRSPAPRGRGGPS